MLEFYADPTNDDHLPEFDPNRRTIVYCAGGARSALAVEPSGSLATETLRTSRAASLPGPPLAAT